MRFTPIIRAAKPDAEGRVEIEVRLDPAGGGAWPAEDGPLPEGGIPNLDVAVHLVGFPVRFPASASAPDGSAAFGTIRTVGAAAVDSFRTTARLLPGQVSQGGAVTLKAVFLHGTRVSGYAEAAFPLAPAPSPAR